jgi:uncharacterized protein YkwD
MNHKNEHKQCLISSSKKASAWFIFFLVFSSLSVSAQEDQKLNTARNCSYMKQIEREMIAEINLVRSDPAGYVKYLDYYHDLAKLNLKHFGKGTRSYSLSVVYERTNRGERKKKEDTVWSYQYEEEVHAIESLIKDLNNTPPLSILQPDRGIYEAARKQGLDQDRHNWKLGHQGSDGSWPWDRILKYSPQMITGNENLAGKILKY